MCPAAYMHCHSGASAGGTAAGLVVGDFIQSHTPCKEQLRCCCWSSGHVTGDKIPGSFYLIPSHKSLEGKTNSA